MNDRDDIERRLAAWFETEAGGSASERFFEEVFRRTSATRQHRRWPLGIDSWTPPAALQRSGRLAWALALVALIAALAVGTLLVGGLVKRSEVVPAPDASTAPALPAAVPATIAAKVTLDARPTAMAHGAGSIWVANGDIVSRIDPATNRVVASVTLGPGASVGAGDAGVWISSYGANVVGRVDPATNTVLAAVAVVGPDFVTVDRTDVWVTSSDAGTVTRIDPVKNEVVATISVGSYPAAVATGDGTVWVTRIVPIGDTVAQVVRIDPATNTVATRTSLPRVVLPTLDRFGTEWPMHAVVADGDLWVAHTVAGVVSRSDRTTGVIAASIPLVEGVEAITAADGFIWVTVSSLESTLLDQSVIAKIDPRTNTVVEVLGVGERRSATGRGLVGLAAVEGSLWVAVDWPSEKAAYRIDVGS